ncbi:Rid family hydrolase [Oceanobacter mangrovi]|uniref:Rid family hydrolase n=1 Tax=Oceanobacter mangrovi TaxID=2862510 RepID=UPI001C8EA597|nr:Rid family hydrolase [Oceanobacter mangrovi]
MSQPTVQHISASKVPELATASWSNALQIGGELVTSGMTGHPATRMAAEDGLPLDAYQQTLLVLGKIRDLAEAAGGHIGNIYRLTVYVTNIADKDDVGRARKDFFASQQVFPTSTLVEVSGLVFPELCVEIEAGINLDVDLRTLTKQPVAN